VLAGFAEVTRAITVIEALTGGLVEELAARARAAVESMGVVTVVAEEAGVEQLLDIVG
jgi:hypothetical protein